MLKYDLEILKKASDNLMFTMEEEQFSVLLEEFKILVSQLSLLDEIDGLEEVEPMDFPYEVRRTILRADNPAKPLKRDIILKNSGDTFANQIKVPKVIK